MGSVNSDESKQNNQIINFSFLCFPPLTQNTRDRAAGSSLLSFILGCTYTKPKRGTYKHIHTYPHPHTHTDNAEVQ